jgi:hypothetical protein
VEGSFESSHPWALRDPRNFLLPWKHIFFRACDGSEPRVPIRHIDAIRHTEDRQSTVQRHKYGGAFFRRPQLEKQEAIAVTCA